MNCYSCNGYILKPIKLDDGLPARECHQCGGLHIDLLSYRSWRDERADNIEELDDVESLVVEDNQKTLVCQRCSKVMLKYRITTDHQNCVDLCTACDDVWLDQGEWRLLKHLHLQGKLTQVMTQPWQRNIRKAGDSRLFDQQYLNLLGQADYERLEEFVAWVNNHELKDKIKNFLRVKART